MLQKYLVPPRAGSSLRFAGPTLFHVFMYELTPVSFWRSPDYSLGPMWETRGSPFPIRYMWAFHLQQGAFSDLQGVPDYKKAM